MRDHFNVKILLPKFCQLEKASSLYLKWFWLTEKSCAEGDQLHGGLAKYVRVYVRFHYTK